MTDETGQPPQANIKTPRSRLGYIDITEHEVMITLAKLKPFKAVGPDDIHPMILKEVLTLAYPLTLLFNQSLQMGDMPED